MFEVVKSEEIKDVDIPFGVVLVNYPEKLDVESFDKFKDKVLMEIKEEFADYERSVVFGNNVFFRYFKKFKKTYTVMQQFESFLLKGREFPNYTAINQVPFLAELKTHHLLGAHDVDKMEGKLVIYKASEKADFEGMGDRIVHTYPNDITGKDDKGIILSMIAGADNRTFVTDDSRNVAYMVFGTEGMDKAQMENAMNVLEEYAKVLAADATIKRIII